MGVECRVYLIPRDNTIRPDPAAIRRLLAAWREAHFLPASPGMIRLPNVDDDQPFDERGALDHAECILSWSIEDRRSAGLKHPLMEIAEDPEEGAYYDIKLHFSEDFVELASELISPPQAICSCGENLAYDPEDDIFYAGRIRRFCPECGEAYRPQDGAADYTDGVTGAWSELPGGATHRFAIVIDCGKHWMTTTESAPPEAISSFMRISSTALGVELYEVADFY